MADLNRPPISFEIAGQNHTFEYGQTECHVYRMATDSMFAHIEAVQYGTQRIYIFNCPRQIMFLTGMQLFPDPDMKKKEVRDLCTAMDNTVGWEADLILRDEAPQEIKDRYENLALKALRKEIEAWA